MNKYEDEIKLIKKTDQVLDDNEDLRKASDEILHNILNNFGAKRGALILQTDGHDQTILAKVGNLNKVLIDKALEREGKYLIENNSAVIPIELDKKLLGVLYLGGISDEKDSKDILLGVEAILDGRFKHEYDSTGLKRLFSRYVGERVMNKILENNDDEYLSGDRHNCSILFADINGFTNYSNTHSPEHVITLLNSYFSSMSPIILKNGGTLDKFIGDEIMAVFGAPIPMHDHASIAVKTAIELIKKSKSVLRNFHIDQGGISIGIATGRVISGNIGSMEATDYTVIGTKVNLASRLTGAAGKNEIYVDETTMKASGNYKFDNLGKKSIKGFGDTSVYTVTDF